MADSKISGLNELAETPANDDILNIVDISDETMGVTGTNKKVTRANLVGGLQAQPLEGAFVDGDKSKLDGIAAGAEVNTVDSVNTKTGAVVINPDDLDDALTTNKFTTAGDISKLAGIETGADVTDATNVASAGAFMASNVIDEDDMVSDSDTKVPTQQSVKAYVTTSMAGAGAGDVVGPASSTDNALARFDSTTGKIVQDSNAILSDSGDLKLTANRYLQADNIEPSSSGSLNFVGKSGTSAYEQGSVVINGGINAGTGDGGSIKLQAGQAMGGGANGAVKIGNTGGYYASLDVSAMTADRTVTLPNADVNLSGGTDGDVLTVQADGSLAVETPSAGGGGQTTYDAIVATSGGTHTTLGAAIAAASNGWRILVLDSTTETSGITTTLTNLTIIGASKSTTVTMGSNALYFQSGTQITLQDLTFSFTTGYLILTGTYCTIENVLINVSSYNTNYHFRTSGDYSKIDKLTVIDTYNGTSHRTIVDISSNYSQWTNSTIIAPSKSTTYATTRVTGLLYINNVMFIANSWSDNCLQFEDVGGCTVSNCFFHSGQAYVKLAIGQARYVNNRFISGDNTRAVYMNSSYNHFSDNHISVDGTTTTCLLVGAQTGNIISNNKFQIGSSDSVGITLSGAWDTVVSGNYAQNGGAGTETGCSIASGSQYNLVTGNNFRSCDNSVTDAGTNNTLANNL